MLHSSKINIRFADIDVMGHVNNAIYLNYFEQARMAWFQEKVGNEWDWNSDGLILARNEVDYKLPLLLHDDAVVEISVEKIGNTSVTLTYEVWKKHKDSRLLSATGRSVLVCFDHTTQQTKRVPESWREGLQ